MANSFGESGVIQPDLYWSREQDRADELRRARQADRIQAAQSRLAVLPMPATVPTSAEQGQTTTAEDDQTDFDTADDYRSGALRRQRQQSRLAAGAKGKAKKALDTTLSPLRRSTSELLAQSWINLIDSFGLTLLWINAHVLLSLIFGKSLFVRLGGEWADIAPGGSAAQKMGGQDVEAVSMGAYYAESMLLLALDIFAVFIVLAIIVTLMLFAMILAHPLQFVSDIFGMLYDMITK